VEVACAQCGCVVDRGLRLVPCGDGACCCRALSTRASLEALAAQVGEALGSRDLDAFGEVLAEDVRWGDDDAPNACRTRAEVLGVFSSFVEDGARGEVSDLEVGPAGVLCLLRVHWPEATGRGRRTELFHLYRVRDGRIVEIEPFDERDAARAALATR
jgi:ketosteroid isomerase-like protein